MAAGSPPWATLAGSGRGGVTEASHFPGFIDEFQVRFSHGSEGRLIKKAARRRLGADRMGQRRSQAADSIITKQGKFSKCR